MTTDFGALDGEAKLLLQAELKPLQGQRFQPTGFADLGAATFTVPGNEGEDGGTDMLLVESPQSIANRLEAVCWDFARNDIVDELTGLPYVRVDEEGRDGRFLTSSLLEAHRLHSPYIMSDSAFFERIKDEFLEFDDSPIDLRRIAKSVYRYDPNSLLHGVFFANKELAGGRVRLQRLLSGFIEARDVRMVESGGVKNDRVNPSGEAKQGYGNVPFHRTEYVAGSITAYFNVDLAGLRTYGLGAERERLLIALAMWKIRRFLDSGLRLRTACDLELAGDITVQRPQSFELPSTGELAEVVASGLAAETAFAKPRVTEVTWKRPAKKSKKSAAEEEAAAAREKEGE